MLEQNSKLFLILPQEIKYPSPDRLLFVLDRISRDYASILFSKWFDIFSYYCSCLNRFVSYIRGRS